MKTSDAVFELFLNYACTAKCPFCYNPPITPELLRRDLSFEQAAAALYGAARRGARRLNLHGGEPTLRDDLPKLLALARRLGFRESTLVTNGVRLSDAGYVRELAVAGLTSVRVSLHAAAAPAHDRLVSIPGAFERATAGLRRVRSAGLALGLNFVLVRSNLAELPAFVRRFVVEEGVGDLIVYFAHLRGMMAFNEAAEGVSYAEAAAPVREAAAALAAAGRSDALWLANVPPCVVPELAGRILDWERHEGGRSAMLHPEGHASDIGGMKAAQKVRPAGCADCALSPRCLGVDREYAASRGGEGLRPLERALA